MWNFTYYNPVEIVFGKGMIAELKDLIPPNAKVMMTYGGGSIKKNGVYDQVIDALQGFDVVEFPGIEPNPKYEHCMKAVELAKTEGVDFLLAVGGGSVIDATKFIAAALCYDDEPWKILMDRGASIESATPMGCVLTLSATGSEMNMLSVISRKETGHKLAFANPAIYPQFSILDPEVTFTLPQRQVSNGIVDTFVHVFEQYMTYDVNAPLQARQAEAILATLIEEAPKVHENPNDYDTRANLMWCATWALNGHLGCGVPQDWTSHMIGHELTAIRGIDHARTLALVLPAVLRHQRENKRDRLLQYAKRIWDIERDDKDEAIDEAIERTVAFFVSVGIEVSKGKLGITEEDIDHVADAIDREAVEIEDRDKLGEHKAIGGKEVKEILRMCD